MRTQHYYNYTKVPDVLAKKCGAIGALIYGRVERFAQKRGYCYASNETIAHECGVDVKTVRKWLAWLALPPDGKPYIVIEPQVGKPHHIYPTDRLQELTASLVYDADETPTGITTPTKNGRATESGRGVRTKTPTKSGSLINNTNNNMIDDDDHIHQTLIAAGVAPAFADKALQNARAAYGDEALAVVQGLADDMRYLAAGVDNKGAYLFSLIKSGVREVPLVYNKGKVKVKDYYG